MPQPHGSELIVVLESPVSFFARPGELPAADFGVQALSGRVAEIGGLLRPGFRRPAQRRAGRTRPDVFLPGRAENPIGGSPAPPQDLSSIFRVEAEEGRLRDLAETLRDTPGVAAVYVQPPTELPEGEEINKMLPAPGPPPPFTRDLSGRQIYLNAAPDGVNADFAWSQPGGLGRGVKVIDIEWSWNLTHENLIEHEAPLYGGAPRDDGTPDGRNHGTAVLGVTSARHSGFGVRGLCPEAAVLTVTNIGGMGTGEVIQLAADMLDPGDILILEMHRPGPNATGAGQRGFIAVEWWYYDLVAIRYAVSQRGVVVVEAAGNGSENLDATIYDANSQGFPAVWSNPFRRGAADSGAILVGAGAPPPGTHGRNHGPARSRLDFSNYGSAVDAQGWGREVTTCGYGDLQGGMVEEDKWYTDEFSGTSSATPIVAGALACVQGARRAHGLQPCTPAQLRSLLRQATGSPQQDGPTDFAGNVTRPRTERIGHLPDLSLLIPEALNLP